MSGKSSIEWTDATWNPTVGCTRVTDGCQNCYAFALHDRRHTIYQANAGHWSLDGRVMPAQYASPFSAIQLLPERLGWPLRQKKPLRIFVNSVSDLFHSQVPDAYIFKVFEVMREAHWHSFQILTKRPARLARLAPTLPWPANIWVGTSVEVDQLTPRIDLLRRVPTINRFLSLEPLLGPLPSLNLNGISWVIVGGESGPEARPMQAGWARDIRDTCLESTVPFFLKQFGGRTPKSGGNELDGRTWQQFPMGMVNTRSEIQQEVSHA